MSSGERPGQAELAFPGDGEMARRMRAYPWTSSPLGDPADWPASLRTACRICLTSRFPMIVWWGEQLFMFYNDAYRPLMGNKHPGLMRPGEQVWGEIWPTVGPMLDSVLHTGQATWSEDLLLPMNRHGYWEETYWTYSYSPLHDDDGTVRGVFTAVKETTEEVVGRRRLAVLQDLGAQAGQARSVAEACDLVVRSLGRAPEVIPFAAVYLRGPDGEAVLASSTAPGGPGGWPVDDVLRSGEPVTLTDVIARFGELPTGGWETPPSEAMVLPLTGGTGEPDGALVLAASAGRALDEAYESFLGLVAQQTAALVGDAVAYQAQLRRAEELAELDRASMRYEVDCPPLSAPVYVDREMWEKVVFNLLSNALKFSFEGTVSVRLDEEDGHAVLRVADTGVGVAAAEIPRLFDRFHRIENVPSRSNEGSGIGLALVRELIGLHGGTITAESDGRTGSTFTVRIPLGRGHLPEANVVAGGGSRAVPAAANPFLLEAMRWLPGDPAPEESAADGPPGAPTASAVLGKAAPTRVLLADDNADMREYLQRLLRPGYAVTTVTDGQAALEAARADPPDILISDVMMPRLGGLQLVAALRADPRTAEVPVLLLSARAGQEAAIEGLEAGADDYLVKPFSAAELLAR